MHKFLCIGLLLVAVLSFFDREAYREEFYREEFTYGEQGIGFSYLQAGEYVLDVYCDGAHRMPILLLCMAASGCIIVYNAVILIRKKRSAVLHGAKTGAVTKTD